jgi:hypothetical protein
VLIKIFSTTVHAIFRTELLKIDSKLGNLKDNFDLIDSLQRKVEQLNESAKTLQNKKAMLERRMTSISSKVGIFLLFFYCYHVLATRETCARGPVEENGNNPKARNLRT